MQASEERKRLESKVVDLEKRVVDSVSRNLKYQDVFTPEYKLAHNFLMLYPTMFIESSVGMLSGIPMINRGQTCLLVAFNVAVLDWFKLIHTSHQELKMTSTSGGKGAKGGKGGKGGKTGKYGAKRGKSETVTLFDHMDGDSMKECFTPDLGTQATVCRELIEQLERLGFVRKISDINVDGQSFARRLFNYGLHGVDWEHCFPLEQPCEEHAGDVFHDQDKFDEECGCTYQDPEDAYLRVLDVTKMTDVIRCTLDKQWNGRDLLMHLHASKQQWDNIPVVEEDGTGYFEVDTLSEEDCRAWSSLAPPLLTDMVVGPVVERCTGATRKKKTLNALLLTRYTDYDDWKLEFLRYFGVFGSHAHPCTAHTRPGFNIPVGFFDIHVTVHGGTMGDSLMVIVKGFSDACRDYLPPSDSEQSIVTAWTSALQGDPMENPTTWKRPRHITGCTWMNAPVMSWTEIAVTIEQAKRERVQLPHELLY